MSAEAIKETTSQDKVIVDPHPPVPPTDLIFDDGEPLESNRHRIAMNALIRSMLVALAERNDYFAGGNMSVYYSSTQVRNRDFRGPDFFVVLNVDGSKDRQGWVVWEEDGRYPDVIIELISPSTAEVDTGIKKEIYEQIFRTPDYYVFDPFDPSSLQGWNLDLSQGYQELTRNEKGWLWCQRLGLWLGTWEGAIEGKPGTWLRFYDQQNNLVLLPEEVAQQRAEVAEHRLETVQQEVACRQLLRLLAARFGEVPQEVTTRLQALDIEQLEDLTEILLTVESLEQFVSLLPRKNP